MTPDDAQLGTPLLINPLTIPDDALRDLRTRVVRQVMDASPELGGWLHGWIDTEQAARAKGETQRKERHIIGLPPAFNWSWPELVKANWAANMLSYCPMQAELAPWLDRLVMGLSQVMLERLPELDA